MRKLVKISAMLVSVFCMLMCCSFTAFASDRYLDSSYTVLIDDRADILKDSEEKSLKEVMDSLAKYGNVYFVSLEKNSTNTENATINIYKDQFGTQSGIIFLIDMDKRHICMHCEGDVCKKIRNGQCITITDNVYKYATKSDYSQCAETAFKQAHSVLSGHKIAQPMKYISNLLLAAVASAVLNFLIAMRFSKKFSGKRSKIDGTAGEIAINDLMVVFNGTTRRYSPVNRDSGSSGGSSSSSGGGGSSGSTGSHSF